MLADISPAEVNEIQQRWVGNVLDHRSFWSDLLFYGLPGLLLLFAVLAAVIRINRRLSSEIARRVALSRNCAAANTITAAW